MAYHKPNDIDGFIVQMGKADMRLKAQLAEDLVIYLSDPENSIICNDLGFLVDNLMPWLTGSHFKIAQRALEAFTELIGRLGQDFSAYTPTVLPHVVDRLGDSRDTVREKAQLLLHKLMESRVLLPQTLLDKLTYCFKHKNSKIREEFLQTIVNTLNEYGTQSLSLKSYIQSIVLLLGDPTSTVRDAAIQTLVEVYKHVGDKLRVDLRKKDIHPSKMAILEQKFDEVKREGLLLPTALSTAITNDELDTPATATKPTRLVKRTASTTSSARKPLSLDVPSSGSGGDAGAVTWEVFEASFDLVPQLTVFSQKDMEDSFRSVIVIIGNNKMDWEKRVDALKRFRSLLQMDTSLFLQFIKDLSIAFLDILKELRSQVIREACISIAFISKLLKTKADSFHIYILQELINLMPSSIKVISSAGTLALKYVVKFTHAPKIIPILTQNLIQSKSKDIRSSLTDILAIVLEEWPTKTMEKYSSHLKDSLIKGISDADSDARKNSRRNFWSFKRHFPDIGDQIYASLDLAVQKAVIRERDMAGSNGTNSMSASLRGSSTSLNSMPGSVIKRRLSSGLRSPATANPSAGFRSVSAVDAAAAQRARARAQYSNLARLKVTSGTASLPRAKKVVDTSSASHHHQQQQQQQQHQASPEHRVASRRAGVSQSQPASRSTSPSSRLYSNYSAYRQTGTIPKKTSGIPRSLVNSRETSPTRGQLSSVKRGGYGMSSPRRTERPPINPSRPVLAQKILQASREAENALADALATDDYDQLSGDLSRMHLNRKIPRDESDESEASSVCSERSFDSYRRNDSGSWNGSRTKLDGRALIEDIETIIYYCSSTHWAERKDGLTSLTQYLSDGNTLTPQQLQSVLDLFRKMFMDSHTKVYGLFLDTVNELIISHSNDLHDWLFILLTRLFNKLGTELLGSMHGKIWKTLRLVHEYFPAELQMQCVFRILCDATQTPSTKTKMAQTKFVSELATTYCKAPEFPTQPPAEKAILKIVTFAMDQKSCELMGLAKQAIIALYNCNTPNMTMFLTNLPKTQQDYAKTVIQQYLRRSASGNNSPSSPLSSSSPKLLLSPQQGPFSLQNHSSQKSRQSSVEHTDQPMNTEEVYRSLRKTTAEIQNYSFETKLDRDTNSKDSGISQMGDHHIEQFAIATNGLNGHGLGFHDKEDSSCNGSKTQSATTTESNTPENTVRLDSMDVHSSSSSKPLSSHRQNRTFIKTTTGEMISEDGLRESEIIKSAIVLNENQPTESITQNLYDLAACIKQGNCELPIKHFKAIMKMILTLLQSTTNEIIFSALQVLYRIICSEQMKSSWINLLELILLKIIDSYKISKEVSRDIDEILPHIAAVLPFDASINILNPVIATGEFPTNLCAIKLLLELVDKQGAEMTDQHLDSVMPNIAKQTDNSQSMVRKAAVFCIVRMYVVLGEEKVRPKFNLLNSSKIRLLNVYIAKAQKYS